MIQPSLFSPYQKRVSSSRRKLKKITHQPKPLKQPLPQQLFKIPILKAFGQRIFLSRNTDDSRFIKKPTFMEENKDQRNKMILIAKKIGCYIDPLLYLQGLRELKREQGKGESRRQRERDKDQSREDKREIRQLQSTMNDSQLRISRLKPSSVSIQASRLHQSFPKPVNSTQQKPNNSKHITYLILSSHNNQQLIRKILSTRKNWKQIKKGEGSPNFRWLAGDYDHAVFEKCKSTTFMKKVVNQFQFHHQITTKNGLIRNLQVYTETKKMELFSMTPITFVIDFDEEYCQFNIRQFLNFFVKNSTKQKEEAGSLSPGKGNSYQKINGFIDKLRPYFNPHPQLRKKLNPLSRPDMKSQYINGDSYLWLLKPTGLNRGRGIQIFDNLDDLEAFFLNYLSLAGRKPISAQSTIIKSAKKQSLGNISTLPSLSHQQLQNSIKRTSNQQFVLKACSFVIQKYIQKPMLINGRKFDIRVWVFLNNDFSIYFFKQGYLRLSSQQFSLDVNNYFIHLTNNAIQKHSKQYGSIQQGNQLSFKTFKQYLTQQGHPQQFQSILSKIKQYSYTSLNSVKSKLNPKQQKYCFQLFGFDYIIDHNYKVWLIQVNNNPCIQLSSPLLGQLIPRMLNDAFKLSTDKIFRAGKDYHPNLNPQKGECQKQKQKEKETEDKKQHFSVDGYSDNQNMWEQLGKLSPNSQYTPK